MNYLLLQLRAIKPWAPWEGRPLHPSTPPPSSSRLSSSFCNPMTNSSVIHLVFYLRSNGSCVHSRAREAFLAFFFSLKSVCVCGGGGHTESFYFIAMDGRRGPRSVSLTPLSACLSLFLPLPLPLSLSPSSSRPKGFCQIELNQCGLRPPLPTCVCVVSAALTQKCAHNQGYKKWRPLMSRGN